MKLRDGLLLFLLLGTAGVMTVMSTDTRQGAYEGFVLAQNTIIPSLTPLLIIFLLIMKTPAKDVLARCFGFISYFLFNLPHVTFPAVLLGLVGGYPTGALLTRELYKSGELDGEQAKRLLRFNFCGGAGFIVTAVGSGVLNSQRAGVILFFSNVLSSLIIGVALSFTKKRRRDGFYSFTARVNADTALTDATTSAVASVLSITAFVMLFSALARIINIDERLLPIAEITSGICSDCSFSLPEMSAYLAFGGLCIHLQLLGIIKSVKMRLWDFMLFRIIGAVLSYAICKIMLLLFPNSVSVFSSVSTPIRLYSSNAVLSALMVLGCFVIILDLRSKRTLCRR